MGLVAGLGLGLVLVLAVEQMDTTFDSIEEFQGYTDLPVLSAVPTIPKRPSRNYGPRRTASPKVEDGGIDPARLREYQEHRLAVLGDPQSIPSEQYGILALKVEQWMEKSGGQVLVVTSAAGGEGKSVTVLVVDSDLRRPRVHECLGLKTTNGFADLLAQTGGEIGPYISKLGNLDVIVGGAPPVNPVGLLASPHARELLARLRKEYALIVVDSPPIVPIADSHILAGMADGVVIVVRAKQTRRELFRRAIQSLGAANVIGVVLNDVEYGDTRYAYGFRNYQRHYLRRG
jgi:capsular exopolysaccharide synthesis family protein